MSKLVHTQPLARPAITRVARRVLALTRRAWRPHAVLRPDLARLPPDDRVRRVGEW